MPSRDLAYCGPYAGGAALANVMRTTMRAKKVDLRTKNDATATSLGDRKITSDRSSTAKGQPILQIS